MCLSCIAEVYTTCLELNHWQEANQTWQMTLSGPVQESFKKIQLFGSCVSLEISGRFSADCSEQSVWVRVICRCVRSLLHNWIFSFWHWKYRSTIRNCLLRETIDWSVLFCYNADVSCQKANCANQVQSGPQSPMFNNKK